MAARTMALDECIRHDGVKMWMELREMPGQAVPVVYYSERIPFLRFDAQDRVLMISVRADYYGTTWRCWDADPGKTDWVQEKETMQVMTREEHADLHSAGQGTGKKAGKTGRKNGPGVKTAERMRKAANRPPAGKKVAE